jgi:hypothetical protein
MGELQLDSLGLKGAVEQPDYPTQRLVQGNRTALSVIVTCERQQIRREAAQSLNKLTQYRQVLAQLIAGGSPSHLTLHQLNAVAQDRKGVVELVRKPRRHDTRGRQSLGSAHLLLELIPHALIPDDEG